MTFPKDRKYFVKTPVTAVGCGNVKKAKARPLKIEIPHSYPNPTLKICHSFHPIKKNNIRYHLTIKTAILKCNQMQLLT